MQATFSINGIRVFQMQDTTKTGEYVLHFIGHDEKRFRHVLGLFSCPTHKIRDTGPWMTCPVT